MNVFRRLAGLAPNEGVVALLVFPLCVTVLALMGEWFAAVALVAVFLILVVARSFAAMRGVTSDDPDGA
jgi:hypothetical protein